jgi:uncharacterized protein (TIGR03437 family)
MTDVSIIRNTAGPVLPALIAGAGDRAAVRLLDFFTVDIRNRNTRAAYARAAELGRGTVLTRSLVLFTLACALAGFADAQFVQQGGKLVGTGVVGYSLQGSSVALSADGSTAIVGGPDDNGYAGAVWVYTRSAGVWTQQGGKLVAADTAGKAQQGVSLALSADGNTAIVGGPGDNNQAGAAWVYTRSGSVWTQQGRKLVGGGRSVALSADGNTAIVGACNGGSPLGGACVYTRSGGAWTQQGGILVAADAVGNAQQGTSVALSSDGNTAIVGGPLDNTGAGAAWVYTRSGGVWTQQGGKLVGSDGYGSSEQGASVALSSDGTTAIVGGPNPTTQEVPSANSGTGAAWVYTRSGGVWAQQGGKLVGTGAVGPYESEGYSVALSSDGNTALVGGPNENRGAGAVWMYTRSGGVWTQHGSKLVGTGAAGPYESEGSSVALSSDGNTALVGGPSENNETGAAWVFVNSRTAPVTRTITGVVNGASFTAGGAVSPGSWVAIFGTGLAPAGDSRTWSSATEIVGGKFPVSLDGTSVTVNSKPAAVEFIQPSQVNIQAPDDAAVGPVQVIVDTATGATDSFTVNYATFAPGFFAATAPYIVAQHADNSYITIATPAKPGEVIVLWGTGFGPANPAVPAGRVFSGANPLANAVTVTIGGQTAAVDFAGVVGAGLVQINVHIPSSISNGDAAVVATVGAVSTQTTANMVPIHN